jgi:ATP/maltotriose-dependent transcriptional regulator MalT
MLGDLTFYWVSTGRFADARRIFEWCLAHDDVDPILQLPARWGAAHVAYYGGDYVGAYQLAIDSLTRGEALGDRRHVARALNTVGTIEQSADPVGALEKLTHASQLARDNGDLWCATDAGQIAGYVHLLLGDVDDALEWLDRTAPDARRLDNAQLLAWDIGGRAWAALLGSDFTRAHELLDAAAHQARRTGDPSINGFIDYWRCQLLAVQGDRAAATAAEHALAAATQSGAGAAQLLLGYSVTAIHALGGDLDQAETAYQRYVDVLAELWPAIGTRLVVVGAAVAYLRGDIDETRRRLERGHAIAPPGLLADRAMLDVIAALVDARRDAPVDLADAEANIHAALQTLRVCGAHTDRLDALEALGVVVARRGHQLEAARIWGARDNEAHRHNIITTVIHRVVAADRAAIIDSADPATMSDAYAAGEALGIDELLAYIGGSRGQRKRPSTGWDSLTPTELAVVSRAAQGLSNRQIGEQMFIGAGTVKSHLAHVYAKLHVTNRTELTAAHAQRRT